MDDRRLERALRQGPPFATTYSPRPVALDERAGVSSPAGTMRIALLIAVTALLLIGMIAGLAAVGMLLDEDPKSQNGWVAFAVWNGDASQELVDRDIYIVGEGQPGGLRPSARRTVLPVYRVNKRRVLLVANGQQGTAPGLGLGRWRGARCHRRSLMAGHQ